MTTSSGHTTVILGSKVIGTPIFAASGEKIGHVQDILFNKLSEKIAFVVIAATFANTSQHGYMPVPWPILDFDVARQGYLLPLTLQQLRNAPMFEFEQLTKGDGVLSWELTNKFYNKV